ncbi:hypothetical protein BaRGS_00016769 [Batillaria attramentaria]|uniref:BHLH domain-containing protein n=1 Tax=Batillaria attramentaria TaxID=370345 RepID=A0ABD0KXP8_9CAEN
MPRRRKDADDSSKDSYTSNSDRDISHKKMSKLQKPVQRNAANARERSRMRVLSKAFSKLKTTLPWVPPDTKLSKLDTLRLASSYIAHLRQILDAEEADGHRNTYIHPLNLTWPFTFNGRSLNDSKNPDSIKCQSKSEGTVQC